MADSREGRLQVGLIGCGSSRRMYGRPLAVIPETSVVAVADPNPENRRAAQDELGVPAGYETAEQMLGAQRLDAVLVASPVFLHEEHVCHAARAGAHVMVEKPMARTVAEADRMIAACDAQGLVLAVGLQRRWLPQFLTASRMIREGQLGHIFHVECHWTKWGMIGAGVWRDSGRCLGGIFQDHGSHTVDLALQWLGPAHACCATAHAIGRNMGAGRSVEDHVNLMIRHTSGATSTHVHSRDSHRPQTELYRIYGTKGTLELQYVSEHSFFTSGGSWDILLYREGHEEAERLAAQRPDDEEPMNELSDGHYSYYRNLVRFFTAVRSGGLSGIATGHDGRRVVEVINAALLSAAEQRWVSTAEAGRFNEAVYAKLLASLPEGGAQQ